ncbi:MAG: hypothetical protein U5R31_04170 [Acidimicrobiia bacterium]|nr:hypothetical protein [Acidimicrobiia bacterium]
MGHDQSGDGGPGERPRPDASTQGEIDELLSPGYAERERQQHVDVLQRVLAGLEAIEVAETPEEPRSALDALPTATRRIPSWTRSCRS